MVINSLLDFFKNICIPLFGYLSDFGNMILNFLFRDINGQPLVYYLFGAGLVVFLAAKIALAVVS